MDLLRRSCHFTHGFTDEKALYTGSTLGQLVGGGELFCIQCVVSLGPAGRRNVRCCVLSDYIFSPKFPSPKNIASCRSIIRLPSIRNKLICLHPEPASKNSAEGFALHIVHSNRESIAMDVC